MAVDVDVTFGQDSQVSAKAVVSGPLYVEIFNLFTVQPKGSFNQDNVIKKGEEFDVVMRVLFRDVLSELKVNYIANLNVLNMKTGGVATPYSGVKTGKLPGGGVMHGSFRWKFKASETGIFLMCASIGFPESKLFDFSMGHIAGSEPPLPAAPTLKIANFYVYDPTEIAS